MKDLSHENYKTLKKTVENENTYHAYRLAELIV
jgi:hypothetical protein